MPKDQVAHALTLLEALNQLFFGKFLGLRLVLQDPSSSSHTSETHHEILGIKSSTLIQNPQSLSWSIHVNLHYSKLVNLISVFDSDLDKLEPQRPPPPGTLRSFADWQVPPKDLTFQDGFTMFYYVRMPG